MKLKELLKELQGYDIKVGAKSQFLYCGECNQNTPKLIERLSERFLEYLHSVSYNKQKGTPAKKIIEMINNYIPFLEREVIEIYDSCIYPNLKIIKVEGKERCKYWDKEEFMKDMRKKKCVKKTLN